MITQKKSLINCEKGTQRLYREIVSSRFFGSKDKQDINLVVVFCLAVAFGYSESKFKKIEKKDYITRVEYLSSNTDLIRFIEAVAISHRKSLEVLSSEKEVIEIAESYANGGITRLYSMVFQTTPGADFDKELELMISKVIKQKRLLD